MNGVDGIRLASCKREQRATRSFIRSSTHNTHAFYTHALICHNNIRLHTVGGDVLFHKCFETVALVFFLAGGGCGWSRASWWCSDLQLYRAIGPAPSQLAVALVYVGAEAMARTFEIVVVARASALVDMWEDGRARLINTDEILAARCTVAHQSVRRDLTTADAAACCSEKVTLSVRANIQNLHRIFVNTYLHSYSTLLIEKMVRANIASIPSITGNLLPSWHCREPQRTFSGAHFMNCPGALVPQCPFMEPLLLNCSKQRTSADIPPKPQICSHCRFRVGH